MSTQWVASIKIINQWGDPWAAGFWRACWQGGIAILLVWGLCRVLPQVSPRVRCWLWRLAYVKLLMALLWTSPLEIPLLHSSRMSEPLSASIQKSSQKPVIYPTSRLPHSQVNETGGLAYSVVTLVSGKKM